MALTGWIAVEPDAVDELRSLGVVVKSVSEPTEGGLVDVDAEVSDEVLEKLDPYWGRWIWGLEPVHTTP